jgi:hypothetical protein
MINLKPFTNSDWQGLAGASPFADGSEPLLGEAKVDGDAATIVLDGEGLCVSIQNEEGDELCSFHWDGLAAARAVALLNPEMSKAELAASPSVVVVG